MTEEQFLNLPKNEQRVLLAKDVLAHIATGSLVPEHQGYVNVVSRYSSSLVDLMRNEHIESFKTFLEHNDCFVCAKGALVCAWARRIDNITSEDISEDLYVFSSNSNLVDLFGPETWDKIEQLYEGWQKKSCSLESIMQNIIDNNGELTFK